MNDVKIFRAKDVPYQTQLIALAAILADVNSAYESVSKEEERKNKVYRILDDLDAILDADHPQELIISGINAILEYAGEEYTEAEIETLIEKRAEQEETTEENREELKKACKAQQDKDEKLPHWYWCGVFGEMYAGAADTQIANDFSEVTSWLRGEIDLPSTVREANFQSNRLLEVQTRASAVYKGVYALLIPNGCGDFRGKIALLMTQISSDAVLDHFHHIFQRVVSEP